jgi:hypothetical protein
MINQGMCKAAKRAVLRGIHQPGDTYKMALYQSSANLDPNTIKTYTPVGEVNGQGYEAGGLVLSGIRYGEDDASLGWSGSPRWPNSSIRARGALVYNVSKNGAALAVLDFGEDKISSVGPWFVEDGALEALIQLL